MTRVAQGPKTVGPVLAGTMRERAAALWAEERIAERRRAEREAKELARRIFGRVDIEFDDFVPEEFRKQNYYSPSHVVTFEVEGLEFNYVAADRKGPESLTLIDACPCGRGPRRLAFIRKLSDLGRALEFDYDRVKCDTCEYENEYEKK